MNNWVVFKIEFLERISLTHKVLTGSWTSQQRNRLDVVFLNATKLFYRIYLVTILIYWLLQKNSFLDKNGFQLSKIHKYTQRLYILLTVLFWYLTLLGYAATWEQKRLLRKSRHQNHWQKFRSSNPPTIKAWCSAGSAWCNKGKLLLRLIYSFPAIFLKVFLKCLIFILIFFCSIVFYLAKVNAPQWRRIVNNLPESCMKSILGFRDWTES